MFPSGKGFYGDTARDGTMYIDDYFCHFLKLDHAGFRTLFAVQFLYRFKIRLKLWQKIRLQSYVKVDGQSCMVAFSKIPQNDIGKLITFFELKQGAQKLRTKFPAQPEDIEDGTKDFLRNLKCVAALVPNSLESSINNRNKFNALNEMRGPPDGWCTVNPNNTLNQVHSIHDQVANFL